MGIGRREFLVKLGALIGGIAISGSASRFIVSDRFVSKDLGLSFVKPDGWIFIHPEKLAKEADAIGEAAGFKEMSPSVMNISKEPWQENPKKFTPGINVWAHNSEEFGQSLDLFVDSMIARQNFYQDFQLNDRIESLSISKCPALLREAHLTFDTIGLDHPTPVKTRFLCLAQEEKYYFIYMCDSPLLGYDEEAVFRNFMNTILVA